MQELNEQQQPQPNDKQTSPSNSQKIRLMEATIKQFVYLLQVSLSITTGRLALFFVIISNERAFICQQAGSNYSQSWNVIFYILAAMMDCLVMLNDWQMYRHIKRERPQLDKIRQELASNSAEISTTASGSHTIYLSIHSMISSFKFRANSNTSISHTVRYLEAVITYYTFGNLALNAQNRNEASFFKQGVLWVYILSIYINVFELDLATMQASQGEYVEEGPSRVQGGELQQIKENYIKRIRLPFEVVYTLTLLAMLAIIVVYYSPSLFLLTLSLSIALTMSELIYEKYLQNRLIGMREAGVERKHLSPYLILWELTKDSKRLHVLISSCNRVIMVMALMAYFRSEALELIESFLFILVTLLFFLGQKLKFSRAQKGKIYLLRPITNPPTSEGIECAICLVNCSQGEKVVQLPCFSNHVYHYRCMSNWFKQRKECPLCRHSLQIYDLTH